MTCKDCYHHDVCHLRISLNMDYDEVKDKPITEMEKRCEYFKNKNKPKHKFRTMTNKEFCKKWWQHHLYCESSNDGYRCPQFGSKTCCKINANEPYKINGKYILIEVKE